MTQPDSARAWLGTGWSFPPDFNRRVRDVTMVSEEEDIRQNNGILLQSDGHIPKDSVVHDPNPDSEEEPTTITVRDDTQVLAVSMEC